MTFSPAGSIPETTWATTEVASESCTEIRIVSASEYATRSRDSRPYDASRLPVATRANGCGPTGTFDPITRTVQSPAAAFLRITASSTFVASKVPPGRDCPCANGAK